MTFNDFLSEAVVSNADIQNTDARADAKSIAQKTRGLMIGRTIDANGNTGTNPNANSGNAFAPDNLKEPTNGPKDEEAGYSVILKNNASEVVYATKGENDELYITIVNKQKMTKRTIALESRGATFLKRFI